MTLKNIHPIHFGLSFVLFFFLVSGAVLADTGSKKKKAAKPQFKGPAAVLEKHMQELFEHSKKVNKPKSAKNKARKKIETSVDWQKISRICLGNAQLKKQSRKDVKKFEDYLHEIISLTAFSKMDSFWKGTTYKLESIDIKKQEALVAARFFVEDDDYELKYYLYKKGKSWLLYDLAYEDIRYSTNINEQIVFFLKDNTFADLLKKLEKRRAELKES